MEKELLEFENFLNNRDGKIAFWWRDDDIRAKKFKLNKIFSYHKYKNKVKTLVKLFDKYQIPAVFAIVPQNYMEQGEWFTKLFQKYQTKVILHGLVHRNFAPLGEEQNEFPNPQNADADFAKILAYYQKFQKKFGPLLLPVFCPPYNNINSALEEKLLHAGLAVSKSNFYADKPLEQHVDYDFCDWSVAKVKPHGVVLQELEDLIKSGRKIIGINGHHACLSHKRNDFAFFDDLFAVLQKSGKISWFNPFEK